MCVCACVYVFVCLRVSACICACMNLSICICTIAWYISYMWVLCLCSVCYTLLLLCITRCVLCCCNTTIATLIVIPYIFWAYSVLKIIFHVFSELNLNFFREPIRYELWLLLCVHEEPRTKKEAPGPKAVWSKGSIEIYTQTATIILCCWRPKVCHWPERWRNHFKTQEWI